MGNENSNREETIRNECKSRIMKSLGISNREIKTEIIDLLWTA